MMNNFESNSYHPSITNILFSNYINYNTLYAMTQFAFAGSNADNVDIYIDMNSIIRKLYIIQDISIEDYSSITSSIINLCAHIRSYFWTRHRTYSRYFIVYSKNNPFEDNNYNASNLAQDTTNRITGIILQNIELLITLCPYLPDIFFFNGENNETAVVIHDLILKCPSIDKSNEHPIIVITKDPMDYQLVAYNPRTFIYRPHKSYDKESNISIDDSWAVTKSCFWKAYKHEAYRKTKSDSLDTMDLSYQLISLFMAIAGLKSRSIRSMVHSNQAIKILKDGFTNGKLINGYNSDIDFLIRNGLFNGLRDDQIENIKVNFSMIDLQVNHMLFSYNTLSKTLINSYINKNDPDEIKHINNVYFEHNPLDLNRL